MSKMRVLAAACLLSVLVLGGAPAAQAVQASVAQASVSSVASMAQPLAASARVLVPAQVGPGPVLDPAGTAAADSQKTKNKWIAGGIALVLLLIVYWGRRTRRNARKTG